MPLAEVEKLLIRQTLTHVTSNRAEAAKALGISRRALQYKLKHYSLLDRWPNPNPSRKPRPPRRPLRPRPAGAIPASIDLEGREVTHANAWS
jgi:hypothetical protein